MVLEMEGELQCLRKMFLEEKWGNSCLFVLCIPHCQLCFELRTRTGQIKRTRGESGWEGLQTPVQACLVSSYFASLPFNHIGLYRLKICGDPASSKSVGAVSPAVFVHFVSLSHFLVILIIFKTFSLLLYLSW